MDTTSQDPLPKELITQLSKHCKTEDNLDGIRAMTWQSLLNQALDTEMDEHLGYKKHESAGRGTDNRRNGHTPKMLQGEIGPILCEFFCDLETLSNQGVEACRDCKAGSEYA